MLESDKHQDKLILLNVYLWNLFTSTLKTIFVLILAIVWLSLFDGGELFEEFESNGSVFDDFIVIPDSSLKEVNVSNDPLNIKADNVSKLTYHDVDSTSQDSTFTEESDLFYSKIDPAIQSTKTLYQGFEDELASIRKQPIRPTSTLNETSDSIKVESPFNWNTTTTVESQHTPFSPFSPNTLDALALEIKRNEANLAQIDSVASPAVKDSVKKALLDEKRFFLSQLNNHLNAVSEKASLIELSDVDADELVKQTDELKSNIDKLSEQVKSLKHRSLEDNNK